MFISSFNQYLLICCCLLIARSQCAALLETSQTTLEILSATWGGADFTQIFQNRYAAAQSKAAGQDPSFTFQASNDFLAATPTRGGAAQYSNFKTVSVKEFETGTLTVPKQADGIWQPPAPGGRNQFIISASWFNKDVTSQVQQQYSQSNGAPSVPTSITVSVAALGPDPAFGINKQLSVTYANRVGSSWQFRVAVDLHQEDKWTLLIRPAAYLPRDLRLNILSATWGGKDYTNWVREHYITNTILNPPTDDNNKWDFSPSNDFFGPDPAPGVHKTFVVAFRFANKVGTTTGPLIDPKQPAIFTSAWWNNGNPPAAATTDQYPILEDFTDIQDIKLDEGDVFEMILPGWPKSTTGTWGSEYQAFSDPNNQPPWVALAVYASIDVTNSVNKILFDQTQKNVKGPLTIANNPGALGIPDPRPGQPNQQLSVIVGWPTPDSRNAYEFRTFAALNGIADITIPRTTPAPGKQYPEPYRSLTVRKVKFTNKLPTSSYPSLLGSDGSRWSGSGASNSAHYHIFYGQSVTVDLLNEGLKSKDGDLVSLGFYTDLIGTHVGNSVRVAEVANVDLIEVIYGEGILYDIYIAGRVVQVVAQVAGLILESVE